MQDVRRQPLPAETTPCLMYPLGHTLKIYFILNYVYLCGGRYRLHAPTYTSRRPAVSDSVVARYCRVSATWHGCWEWNSGAQQGQQYIALSSLATSPALPPCLTPLWRSWLQVGTWHIQVGQNFQVQGPAPSAIHHCCLSQEHLRTFISYVISSVVSPSHRFSHFISQWPYGVISQMANLSLNLRILKKKSHPEDLGFVWLQTAFPDPPSQHPCPHLFCFLLSWDLRTSTDWHTWAEDFP